MDETMNNVAEQVAVANNAGFDFGSGLIGFGAGVISTIVVGATIKLAKKIAPKKTTYIEDIDTDEIKTEE